MVGLALRLWGINFGLPYLYHPDEGALVMPAINILRTGDFRPLRLDYGSAYIYSLTGLYIPYFLYGAWHGTFHAVSDLPVFLDPRQIDLYPFPGVYLIARAWTALLGGLTILAAYALGRRLGGQRVGLAAAFFCALAPYNIQNAHFATTDVPMTFVVTLALVRIVDVFDSGRWRDYAWAGLFAGLSASTKYPGGIVLIALLVAHVLRARRPSDVFNGRLALGVAATAGGFLLGTPYALDLPFFLNWLADNLHQYGGLAGAQAATIAGSSARYYVTQFLSGPAAPMLILGLLGCAWLWKINWRRAAVLCTFPVLFAVLISLQRTSYPRFLVPLEPVLAVGAGLCVVTAANWLASRQRENNIPLAFAWCGSIGLLMLFPLLSSVNYDYHLAGPDVRTTARLWVDENIPIDARVAADPMGPPLADRPALYLTWNFADHDPDWYVAQKFDFLIISESRVSDANLTLQAVSVYRDIQQRFQLVQTFDGAMLGVENQHIWVYRVAP